MPTVLIPGGTGLIGRHLSQLLREHRYDVLHLSRTRNLDAEFPAYHWDIQKQELDLEAIERADYMVNLAGAGIADGLWTQSRREAIINSRVDGALLLREGIQKVERKPTAYISSSANGIYGDRGAERLPETAPPGTGFLADTTKLWETAIDKVKTTGVRVAGLRTGIVLSTQGGAFEKIYAPFKFGLGSYFGDGSAYYAWIHIDDICRMYLHLIEHDLSGYFNGNAPEPVTIKELAYAIKEVRDKPALVAPVPAFALRMTMGEMADVVLSSTRADASKIGQSGFEWKFAELKPALRDLIVRQV